MSENNIKRFEDEYELAESLAEEFVEFVSNTDKDNVDIALAGGGTPQPFYEKLAEPRMKNKIDWTKVRFYWGDERCVPPDDSESNFGMVKQTLLDKVDIPEKNVFRIECEQDVEKAAREYSEILYNNLEVDNVPRFDWIFLGLGTDGHTASLFPESENLDNREEVCVIAYHPQTGQKRVSITIPVINKAQRVTFLVTGERKKNILKKVLVAENNSKYPASFVQSKNKLEWYIDDAAGRSL